MTSSLHLPRVPDRERRQELPTPYFLLSYYLFVLFSPSQPFPNSCTFFPPWRKLGLTQQITLFSYHHMLLPLNRKALVLAALGGISFFSTHWGKSFRQELWLFEECWRDLENINLGYQLVLRESSLVTQSVLNVSRWIPSFPLHSLSCISSFPQCTTSPPLQADEPEGKHSIHLRKWKAQEILAWIAIRTSCVLIP